MKRWLRMLVPPALLLLGACAAWALAQGRPVPVSEPEGLAPPVVRVIDVVPGPLRILVRAHGTVQPRTESDLVPEVSGRVTWLSPALATGGFFGADDLLLEIDRGDYENAVRRARAKLAQSESQVRLAQAELERAITLAERDVASASALDRQQSAEKVTMAVHEEAEAALDQALRDLERSHLRAPFAGRVRSKSVDVGQFVARGAPVARLYAVDFAEVRLPVRDADLAYLDIPLGYRGSAASATEGPTVFLRGHFAGRRLKWQGRIVRSEGEIDAQSRMLHLVARVEDPYGRYDDRPPLSVGLFVEAEILGRTLEDVLVVPRAAVRQDGRIAVVDADERLRLRQVEVLRLEGENAVVRARLDAGERLCISLPAMAVDGMRVQALSFEGETGALAIAEGAR